MIRAAAATSLAIFLGASTLVAGLAYGANTALHEERIALLAAREAASLRVATSILEAEWSDVASRTSLAASTPAVVTTVAGGSEVTTLAAEAYLARRLDVTPS